MRWSVKQYLGGIAVLCLALPVWARPEKPYTAEWDLSQTTTIGNTQIKPGTYTVEARANENTLDVLHDRKVVAQVPCHWIQLPQKASETEVETNNNQIVQVQFSGKTEAVTVGH
ncbi:MAG TPA: hypothetical protein VMD78_03620 [Candidatus Baltobacteraceae bacterium]|nr:hypothetical protein [Candidatus Baltobacteraceae bacterium]